MDNAASGPEQSHFINRELSWLEFNQRVLDEALDPANPLLERVKFFCITSSNLDEFFEVRVAGLKQQMESEVVERITSPPGNRDYGYLSVLVQYHCHAAKLFDVPPEAFRPRPKVQSAILRLIVRERPAVDVTDEARFFALVRAAFAQRRKTIANNLKAARYALGFTAEIASALEQAGINPQRRAETLSLAEFAALFHALFEFLR